MTDKNDALFLVRLPFGQKTIPYEEVPELIAKAKSPGDDDLNLGVGVCKEKDQLRAAVQAGKVEVLDKSLHRVTQTFNGRLKYTVLTVQALRKYVKSIKGFLEVEDAPAAKVETIRGITKSAVIDAFAGLHFDRDQWTKALGKNIPNWLVACRVMPGKQGSKVSATWNPVLIAAALIDKGITVKGLNAVFVGLKDWTDEWHEASELFRD